MPNEYYRIVFATHEEGAAFVAALSRYVSSPAGVEHVASGKAVEVRSYNLPEKPLELFLSRDALKAAAAAFSPLPSSEMLPADHLPAGSVLILEGAGTAWGIDQARRQI